MTNSKNSDWSLLERFFIFCSGADAGILKKCSRGIKGKYIALGWLVLTPAVLALWSGSYFFSTIFKDKIYLAVFFGFLWGLIILNIDRYLIITFEKSNSLIKDIFSFSVISRLIIAVFIAYVIAHPIVLRLFSDNIEEYIYSQNETAKEEMRNYYNNKIKVLDGDIERLNKEINENLNKTGQADNLIENKELAELRKEVGNSGKELAELRKELNKAHEELSDEIAGNSSRTSKKGYGPVARSIEMKIDSLKNQIQKAEEHYNRLEKQFKNATERESAGFRIKERALDFEEKEMESLINRNTGIIEDKKTEVLRIRALRDEKIKAYDRKAAYDFLARSNALDELSRENYNVRKWSQLLTLIFILLDILPILWKVIPRKDAYDLKMETYRLSAEDFESVERKAIEKMREIREETAVKVFHYENIKHEMGQLGNHKSGLLKMFNDFLDVKVTQDQFFIDRIKKEKTESDGISELDGERKIEEGIQKIIKGYFNHTSDMTKEMIDFLNNEKELKVIEAKESKIKDNDSDLIKKAAS